MLQIFFELTPNVFVEMQTVRFAGWSVGVSAEVGEPSVGKLPFDDPGGTLDIKGWRQWYILETTANPTLLAAGRIMAREVKRGDSERGSLRTGADRWWDCDAVDQNILLGARHFNITSANRPAETVGERLAWVIGTSELLPLDGGHVTYPTNRMDAADYTLQTPADVLSDCAQVVGYNFFALRTSLTFQAQLFFMDPNSSDWASTLRITDDPADIDSVTTFGASYTETVLRRTPERIASEVFVPYNGGSENSFVSASDSAIGDEFAFVDRVAPMANVKTAAKAQVIADRHLETARTEDDRITCSIEVAPQYAGDLRPFHLVEYKSTWVPGYSVYTWMRVVQWAISQTVHGTYKLDLELSPTEETLDCEGAIAAADPDEATGLESGGDTASVSSTVSGSGYLFGILLGTNQNAPQATGMGTPSGYTSLYSSDDLGGSTWCISGRAVSAGSHTMSASFTRGFGNIGVWLAAQVWLPWEGLTIVQERFDINSASETFDDPVTSGNIILMVAIRNGTGSGPGSVPDISPGFVGPTTGWTELWHVNRSNGNSWALTACWARCADPADGELYDWDNDAGGPQSSNIYIVEVAAS